MPEFAICGTCYAVNRWNTPLCPACGRDPLILPPAQAERVSPERALAPATVGPALETLEELSPGAGELPVLVIGWLRDEYCRPMVAGIVENRAACRVEDVSIAVPLYNAPYGLPNTLRVGTAHDAVESLAPGERWLFQATPDEARARYYGPPRVTSWTPTREARERPDPS